MSVVVIKQRKKKGGKGELDFFFYQQTRCDDVRGHSHT